jgi:hypothetical protein
MYIQIWPSYPELSWVIHVSGFQMSWPPGINVYIHVCTMYVQWMYTGNAIVRQLTDIIMLEELRCLFCTSCLYIVCTWYTCLYMVYTCLYMVHPCSSHFISWKCKTILWRCKTLLWRVRTPYELVWTPYIQHDANVQELAFLYIPGSYRYIHSKNGSGRWSAFLWHFCQKVPSSVCQRLSLFESFWVMSGHEKGKMP